MTCDMSKPCKFLSLDSCQQRFLWTYVVDRVLKHNYLYVDIVMGDRYSVQNLLGHEKNR